MNRDLTVELRHAQRWYFRVVNNKNHKVVLVGQVYKTKWTARRAAKNLAARNGFQYAEKF